VTHKQKGDLAKRVLRLEATDAEAGWHGLFAEGGSLPPATQSLVTSAHSIYTFLPVNQLWHDNLERLNPLAKRVAIDAKMPADYPGHLTSRMVDVLQDYPAERAAVEQI